MRDSSLGRLLRFALVGVGTNLAGYLVYLTITFYGVAPKLAMTMLYGVGVLLGFVGNRQWTFRHSGNLWRSAAGYIVCHAMGYGLNYLLLAILVDQLGFSHQLVQAAAIIVVAAYLFVALNYLVFRTRTPPGAAG